MPENPFKGKPSPIQPVPVFRYDPVKTGEAWDAYVASLDRLREAQIACAKAYVKFADLFSQESGE